MSLTRDPEARRLAGARELALDAPEQAQDLISLYGTRGYHFVEQVQWNVVNYRCVILSNRPQEGTRA